MAEKAVKKQPRFILVSDLDWTMVDHDDKTNTSLLAFNKLWEEKFARDSLLVFSTGRSYALYTELRKEVPLGNPDILVCSVGTEIFYEATAESEPVPDPKWIELLNQGWDRSAVVECAAQLSGLSLQAESEQRPHKVSYRVGVRGKEAEEQIERLRRDLSQAGLSAKVIYSGGEDLDVLPQQASKGKGLEFLLKEIQNLVGSPQDGVLVNGDSGNDVELFQVPGVRGTMVSNAHPELRQWVEANQSPNIFQASKRCAGGILEAIDHFSLSKS